MQLGDVKIFEKCLQKEFLLSYYQYDHMDTISRRSKSKLLYVYLIFSQFSEHT